MRLVLSCMAAACLVAAATATPDLQSGFVNPPASAKAHTWWHWINGNITKEGITADLVAMKKFGLGGAQIFNVDVGIPVGDRPFMSARWKSAIAWAFQEAKRLHMELDIHNGAGWSSSGGPWVKPEYAMQFLTWSEKKVQGPTTFHGTLPEPPKKWGYYKDIACYAVRTPANDKFRIDNIRTKAAFDRGDNIDPESGAIPADAATRLSDVRQVTMDAHGHVTAKLPAGEWTIIRMGHTPTGAQNEPSPRAGLGPEVDKLSRTALDHFWSGMMATAVKENGTVSKYGLIGALIDSYEVGSQNWTPKFREEFMKRRGYDPMPYLVTVTGRVVKSGAASERFLWDLRRTVCDLFADNYYGYMTELCHRNGLQFSTEGYGNGDFDNLQVNGRPDIPMAEFWIGGGAAETTKMVSSSAHIYGKRIVGAESFTADDSHAKWLYDPYSMKVLGDQMFTLGINRYIFHRYALQPWLNEVPGMTMGPWGTNFDRTITWWDQGRAWMEYVARCQYMLQRGRFAADVLVFEGDDGPNDLPYLRNQGFAPGYDYDGCSSEMLQQAHVEDGQIVLPSGMRYRVMTLQHSKWMTQTTLRKIARLVRQGATIVGDQPEMSPTNKDAAAGDDAIKQVGTNLWAGHDGKGHVFSTRPVEKVLHHIGVSEDVTSSHPIRWIHRIEGSNDIYFVSNPNYHPLEVNVDFRVHGKSPEIWNPETGKSEGASVWHPNGDHTEVSLRLESAGSTFVVFRHGASQSHVASATWLGTAYAEPKPPKVEIVEAHYEADDSSGGKDVTASMQKMVESGATSITASNSNFGDPAINHVKHLHVVYTIDGTRHESKLDENATLDLVPAGADNALPNFTVEKGKIAFWRSGSVLVKNNGRLYHVTGTPSAKTINVPWTLHFPPHRGAPSSTRFEKLISWPDSNVDGVKYFSGTATYNTTFQSGHLSRHAAAYWLDLGKVKNFAEITLNGHSLPTLWKAPFRIDVSPWLKQGSNHLEVKVTNLWPNRLIGDERYPPLARYDGAIQAWPDWIKNGKPKPPTKRVTFTTWQFFKKDSTLLESGLIGPVVLRRVPLVKLNDVMQW